MLVPAAAMVARASQAGKMATPPLVDRLLAESEAIRTVPCEIRRETEGGRPAMPHFSATPL
jgi:hypothetical protein